MFLHLLQRTFNAREAGVFGGSRGFGRVRVAMVGRNCAGEGEQAYSRLYAVYAGETFSKGTKVCVAEGRTRTLRSRDVRFKSFAL